MAQWLVTKLSKLMRISVRTLHHYDVIGLLKPSLRLDNGYRVYSEADLQRLQQILALKFLGFELAQIKQILEKKISPLAHLELQSTLLRKKAKALVDASEALDAAIVKCKEQKSVDWQTIIKVTEVYSMIDALREVEIAHILNDEQLKQLLEYYAAVATDPEASALRTAQAALLNELKTNVDKDPTGEYGIKWAQRWIEMTGKMIELPLVKKSSIAEVMMRLFNRFDERSEEDKLKINNLMREAGRLTVRRFGTSVAEYPDMTDEMMAWMNTAMNSLAWTKPEAAVASCSESLEQWIEHYTVAANDSSFTALMRSVFAHGELLKRNLDKDPNGEFGMAWTAEWMKLCGDFDAASRQSSHFRILLSTLCGNFTAPHEERTQLEKVMKEAARIVASRTGVGLPVGTGPTPEMRAWLDKVVSSQFYSGR